ncbi:MAG: hypothetical protein ABJN35_11340 [Erythrobacter sp.]
MDTMVDPEVWAMIVVASCFAGWVLGNLNGAARAEQDRIHRDSPGDDHDAIMPIPAAPKVNLKTAAKHKPNKPSPKVVQKNASIQPFFKPTPPRGFNPIYGRRRQVFMDIPSVNKVRAKAQHILQTDNVWTGPDARDRIEDCIMVANSNSADLLNHYRSSIAALQRSNEGKAMGDVGSVGGSARASVGALRTLSTAECHLEKRKPLER